MSFESEQAMTPELGPGERLLWSGRPRQGLTLRPMDALMIPFSLMWTAFAAFWEWSVIQSHAPVFFVLWGVPFLIVGAFMVVGRFFFDSWLRARTFYGVTERRVLIVGGMNAGQIKSLALLSLNDVTLDERGGGAGSIFFGPADFSDVAGGPWIHRGNVKSPPKFEMIEDVRRVYETIRDAQQRAGSRP